MRKTPVISDAEWKVMKVLWESSPRMASEVIRLLSPAEDWHPNTIKTLLSRLLRKGALRVDKHKNMYLYHAAVSEADCVRTESESFLDRVFRGAVKPLLVHFVEHQKLSRDDVEELRQILKRKSK